MSITIIDYKVLTKDSNKWINRVTRAWANIVEGWANPSVAYAPVCAIRIIN